MASEQKCIVVVIISWKKPMYQADFIHFSCLAMVYVMSNLYTIG